ncbi:nuclease HARBI1 [Labeo rohita]|uniref:Nuclease HARBI1 n=1 Tax=Labeo rohita TaxID=84645 RepID=A0A498P1Y1_LABRO|nr:nuclease HARBI1 [Labeo rohita]RXN38620.1 nuclease HARBI1 [Labeo rohita]
MVMVSKHTAERMKNDQKFLSSVMAKVTAIETKQDITHKMTLLLLDLTRTYQQLYFRNKSAFYKKLQTAFSQKGYTLSNEKIRKKLTNMLTTYKRVKDRRSATGEGKQTWEYYTALEPPELGLQNAKCTFNDYTGRIELSVKASLPSSQVSIVSVRPHKLRIGRISNYMHSLWNKGMGIIS